VAVGAVTRQLITEMEVALGTGPRNACLWHRTDLRDVRVGSVIGGL